MNCLTNVVVTSYVLLQMQNYIKGTFPGIAACYGGIEACGLVITAPR